MSFLRSLHATHPTPSPCSHQRSALAPQGSAMFTCLPTCRGCYHHSHRLRSGQEWPLSQCLAASAKHRGTTNQVAQTPTLLFQAAEMTLWITCVHERSVQSVVHARLTRANPLILQTGDGGSVKGSALPWPTSPVSDRSEVATRTAGCIFPSTRELPVFWR